MAENMTLEADGSTGARSLIRSGIVNAFTDNPFGGNPAAVVLVPDGETRDEAWMQGVAAEFNLAETAFLERMDGAWGLRWFTPKLEVVLCGHATLASAHWLWDQGLADGASPITFRTASGPLTATAIGDRIALDFPLRPVHPSDPPPRWREALGGIEAEWIGSTDDRPASEQNSVILTTENNLRALVPELPLMKRSAVAGWIVTAPAEDEEIDFVSRYFAPADGIDEDPVTGSAHCALIHFWADRLGKGRLRARQISSRQGDLEVALSGSDRVELRGASVTVANVDLLI